MCTREDGKQYYQQISQIINVSITSVNTSWIFIRSSIFCSVLVAQKLAIISAF